jgi:hypothetical protein
MRFCVDCRFYEAAKTDQGEPTCAATMDLVTGQPSHRQCLDERSPVIWAQCGMDGKLFKQRGEAGVDPRKVHGEPPSRNIAGGNRRDLKRGRSDDDGPQRAEGGA